MINKVKSIAHVTIQRLWVMTSKHRSGMPFRPSKSTAVQAAIKEKQAEKEAKKSKK